jgi:phage/plasmid primase-like uncharacterized protein
MENKMLFDLNPQRQETKESFSEFILKNGFDLKDNPIPDGEIHRFGKKKSCWYVYFQDGDFFGGAVGDWKTDDALKWNSSGGNGHKVIFDQRIIVKREDRKKEAEKEARSIWEKAIICDNHPYLEKKGIKSIGEIKLFSGKIIIPCYGEGNQIVSCQSIDADGEKRFTWGSSTKNVFTIIPGNGQKTAIVEGYATGASVHMATGWAIIIAFNANNLPGIAELFKHEKNLVVLGDNDFKNDKNIGKIKAEEAAKIANCSFKIPEKVNDWNDYHKEFGIDALKNELIKSDNPKKYRLVITDWGMDKYSGKPPAREWLVSNTIPMQSVTIFAAMGDSGKGLMLLDLALKVSGKGDFNQSFGNDIKTKGSAVVIMAEDDKDEVHRRLYNLGMQGDEKLYAIPLPNSTGPMPFIVPSPNGPQFTQAWVELCEQLEELKPSLIIIDPMASFVMADINSDPACGAFMTGLFAGLATRTRASVFMSHHLGKMKSGIRTPEDARQAIRGSTAIVDGARAAYCLWQAEEATARKICKSVRLEYLRNRVFHGCIVKSNGPADRSIKTYIRNDIGLLIPQDIIIRKETQKTDIFNIDLLEKVIGWAADVGHPFQQDGAHGIFKNNERLPEQLRILQKKEIDRLLKELLKTQRIFKNRLKNGQGRACWLDIPSGKFTRMEGELSGGKAPNYDENKKG